ncbi:hypothetical protein L2E82_09862 [Cichorium intybus]|uniref:Uncharacterized protein n=1 Tax=Cichorium intybus TaxID=13427 RepID=A0ACB9G998_CICIN|nr:hypothetical protein L2E82_09862 [Cichorium intybus]
MRREDGESGEAKEDEKIVINKSSIFDINNHPHCMDLTSIKDKKSVKSNLQHKQHHNGQFSAFKFANFLDPEASWDKL